MNFQQISRKVCLKLDQLKAVGTRNSPVVNLNTNSRQATTTSHVTVVWNDQQHDTVNQFPTKMRGIKSKTAHSISTSRWNKMIISNRHKWFWEVITPGQMRQSQSSILRVMDRPTIIGKLPCNSLILRKLKRYHHRRKSWVLKWWKSLEKLACNLSHFCSICVSQRLRFLALSKIRRSVSLISRIDKYANAIFCHQVSQDINYQKHRSPPV